VDGKRNESAQIREKEDFMSAFYTTHARETHRIERQLASFARKNLPIFSPSPLQVFTHVLLSLFFYKGEREKISKKKKNPRPGYRARDKRRERLTDETVAEVDKVNIFVARTKMYREEEHPCLLLFICVKNLRVL
jgi:hypothetical protein